MNNPERFVTFPWSIDQNPKGDEVVNLVIQQILTLHFLVDAVKVFRPPADFCVDAFRIEFFANDRDDLIDVFFAVALFLSDIAL
jgi:hypothetical protein